MTRPILILPGIIFVLLASSAIHPVVLAAPTPSESFNEPERAPTRRGEPSSDSSGLLGATYSQDLPYSPPSPPPAGASVGSGWAPGQINTAQQSTRREVSIDSFLPEAHADSGWDGPSQKEEHPAKRDLSDKTYRAQSKKELDKFTGELEKWDKEADRDFANPNHPRHYGAGRIEIISSSHLICLSHLERLIEILSRIIAIFNDPKADETTKESARKGIKKCYSILAACHFLLPGNNFIRAFYESNAMHTVDLVITSERG
ncbi:hypothetical protein FB446DRAFT_783081 [Lentinula raphanica]|nr:hypothetical protein FB446DRAFT_783081 [Lentinula raphanica]